MSRICPSVIVVPLTVATIVFKLGSCALTCEESMNVRIAQYKSERGGIIFSSSGARVIADAVDTVI